MVGDRLTIETACSQKCHVTYIFLRADNWKKVLCKLSSYLHHIKLFALALQICFSEAWTCTFQILKILFPYNVTLRTQDLSRMQQISVTYIEKFTNKWSVGSISLDESVNSICCFLDLPKK